MTGIGKSDNHGNTYPHDSWDAVFRILDEEYETAPANDTLQDFFMDFKGKENANRKLRWPHRNKEWFLHHL